MVSELFFTILLLSNYSATVENINFSCDLNENVLIESTDYYSTYATSRGTLLTLYRINDDILDRSNSHSYFYNNYINNKYYMDGYPDTYNSNPLMVGTSLLLDPYGNNIVYRTVFGLNLYSFPNAAYIINAGLSVEKESGLLNGIACYKANNISYSNINGTASFSESYIGYSYVNSNHFDFDLTSEIVSSLNSNNYNLNIVLKGIDNYKTCNLYSVSGVGHCPCLYVEYNLYGNAPDYSSLSWLTSSNCLGFVRKLNQIIDITPSIYQDLGNTHVNSTVMQTIVFNTIANNFGPSYTRILAAYNSIIYPNERRIACRLKLDDSNRYAGDFHFVCQCSDGSWAAKLGYNGEIHYYSLVNAPEVDTEIWSYGLAYNSPILYFAYSYN